MAGLFENKKRATFMDFSDPILSSPYHLFYRNTQRGISDASAIDGRRVGVTAGSFHETYLREHYLKVKLVLYKGYAELFRAAQYGSIDLLVTQPLYLDWFQRKHDFRLGFRMLITPLYVRPYKAGLAKGRSELIEVINRHFADIDVSECTNITGFRQSMPE